MNAPWYRMHANLGDTKVLWRAVTFLGTSPGTAAGHLALFWGKVSQHCPGGDISQLPDAQLESWAMWDGEPGMFARFIREQHCTDGKVNDWEEFNGPLEERRRKERERKAAQRSRGRAQDVPRDVPRDTPRDGRTTSGGYDTKRDEKNYQLLQRAREEAPPENDDEAPDVSLAGGLDLEPFGTYAPFVAMLLRSAPFPPAVAGSLRSYLEPMGGPVYTHAEVGQAVMEFLASSDRAAGTFNAAYFAGFVQRVRKRREAVERKTSHQKHAEAETRHEQRVRDEDRQLRSETREALALIAAFRARDAEGYAAIVAAVEREAGNVPEGPMRTLFVEEAVRSRAAQRARELGITPNARTGEATHAAA